MFPSKETYRRILSNIAWAFTGKIISLLSVLIVGILVARYLGPAQYGLLNYVISYVTLFTIISNFGLDDIEVREMSKSEISHRTLIWTGIRLRILLASVAYALIIATILIHRPESMETTCFILVYGLTVFPGCFNSVRNYFTSQLLNRRIVQSEIIRTVICALLKIALLYFKASLFWFILASALDIFIVSIGYYLSLRSHNEELCISSSDSKTMRYLLIEAFPLMLSSSAIVIYQKIDQVMIGDMIDKTSVGYFATAGRFADLVVFIPIILCQTMTPILVNAKSTDSTSQYYSHSKAFISIILWSSIIFAFIMSITSTILIKYTFGTAYLASIPILQIMSWKAVGTAMSTASGQLIIIDRTQKWVAIRNLIGCVVCIILNLLIIPVYGAVGSAIVTVVTVMFSGLIANAIIPKYRKYFMLQVKAFISGPIDLFKIKSIYQHDKFNNKTI